MYKILCILVSTATLFLLGCVECETNKWKCKNDVAYHCVGPENAYFTTGGFGPRWEKTIDCKKYGAVCEHGTKGYAPFNYGGNMEEFSTIACVVPEYKCEAGRIESCVNEAIVSCTLNKEKVIIIDTMEFNTHEYKETKWGWIDGPDFTHCVESEETGEAYFAYSDQSCIDGEVMCSSDEDVLTCKNGYFTQWDPCLEEWVCIESEPREGECVKRTEL